MPKPNRRFFAKSAYSKSLSLGSGRVAQLTAALLAIILFFAISGARVEGAALGNEEPDSGSSKDPIKMVISLNQQRIDVYQGRDLLYSSRISSGKRGYSTPSGIFSILQRNRFHRSNIYSNAPMPFMQRLTWSGIALHAGYVPNYPASHGCVRLPTKFATRLFKLTSLGQHVIIAQDETRPQEIVHPALFQPISSDAFTAGAARAGGTMKPIGLDVPDEMLAMANVEADLVHQQALETRAPEPLRILITRRTGRERLKDIQSVLNELGFNAGEVDGYMGRNTAQAILAFQKSQGLQATGLVSDDLLSLLYKVAGKGPVLAGHVYVRQNFKDIFDAPVRIHYPEEPLGTYMYSVQYFEPGDGKVEWLGLVVDEDQDGFGSIERALDRIVLPDMVRTYISERLTPGTSLIISDNGISRETGRGTDFVVLTD